MYPNSLQSLKAQWAFSWRWLLQGRRISPVDWWSNPGPASYWGPPILCTCEIPFDFCVTKRIWGWNSYWRDLITFSWNIMAKIKNKIKLDGNCGKSWCNCKRAKVSVRRNLSQMLCGEFRGIASSLGNSQLTFGSYRRITQAMDSASLLVRSHTGHSDRVLPFLKPCCWTKKISGFRAKESTQLWPLQLYYLHAME